MQPLKKALILPIMRAMPTVLSRKIATFLLLHSPWALSFPGYHRCMARLQCKQGRVDIIPQQTPSGAAVKVWPAQC